MVSSLNCKGYAMPLFTILVSCYAMSCKNPPHPRSEHSANSFIWGAQFASYVKTTVTRIDLKPRNFTSELDIKTKIKANFLRNPITFPIGCYSIKRASPPKAGSRGRSQHGPNLNLPKCSVKLSDVSLRRPVSRSELYRHCPNT
jgi:hypothetical protein